MSSIINTNASTNALLNKFTENLGKLYWDGREIAFVAASSPTPPQDNVVAYFDASDDSKKFFDTSGGVNSISSWTDSVNNYVVSQTTKSKQFTHVPNAINGKSIVRANGGPQQAMESATSTILTSTNFPANEGSLIIAIRFASNLSSGNAYGLAGTGGSYNGYWYYPDGHGYFDEFRNPRLEQYPSVMPIAAGNYIISVRSGSGANTYEVIVNGVSAGLRNPAWALGNKFYLGRDGLGNYATCDYLGVVLLNSSNSSLIDEYADYFNEIWEMGL